MVTIFLATGLAACGSVGGSQPVNIAMPAANGPQADYPIIVGNPYVVGDVTYTPADVLNYDEVGYLAVEEGMMGYTAAHHTLPVPSYAEVTSLETGRTVLVRIERRGPMASNDLMALSPTAITQLGASAQTPVRVRRVNPPEEQRAILRSGNAAPLRMDTPMSLVTVLRRRLPAEGSASLRSVNTAIAGVQSVDVAASTAIPVPAGVVELPPIEVAQAETMSAPAIAEPVMASTANAPVEEIAIATVDVEMAEEADAFEEAFEPGAIAEANVPELPAMAQPAAVEPAAEPVETAIVAAQVVEGDFSVQAATFANPDNARRAASALGGTVLQSGEYYRVRTGPFVSRGEAEASLVNVRRAGYTDARILTSG